MDAQIRALRARKGEGLGWLHIRIQMPTHVLPPYIREYIRIYTNTRVYAYFLDWPTLASGLQPQHMQHSDIHVHGSSCTCTLSFLPPVHVYLRRHPRCRM
jgi:hypothetical protein